MHSMIVYKFPIHNVYEFWSWATQIMKIMIFDKFSKANGRQSIILALIHL